MIVCSCGLKHKPRVSGPIRCICGNTIFHDTKIKKEKIEKKAFDFLFKKQEGAAHWNKLHKYAVDNKNNWDKEEAKKWFELWEQNIPNISCGCRKHWFTHKEELPPNFNTNQDFFEWTVDIHNVVNKRLDKPIISYKEAQEIHGF